MAETKGVTISGLCLYFQRPEVKGLKFHRRESYMKLEMPHYRADLVRLSQTDPISARLGACHSRGDLSSMCNPLDTVHTPSDIVLMLSRHRDRMRSNSRKNSADPF